MTENQSAISHKSGMLSKWIISWSTMRLLCQDFSIAKLILLEHQIPLDLPIDFSDLLDRARNAGTFSWQPSKWRSELSKTSTSSWLNRRSKETCSDQLLKTTSTRRKILKQSSGTLREDQRIKRWIVTPLGGGLFKVQRQSKCYKRYWELICQAEATYTCLPSHCQRICCLFWKISVILLFFICILSLEPTSLPSPRILTAQAKLSM